MLTIEQRAHDLAIAMLPILYKSAMQNSVNKAMEAEQTEAECRIDVFKIYQDTYDAGLEAFKRQTSGE